MPCAARAPVAARGATAETRSGCRVAHSSAWNPPIEPPMATQFGDAEALDQAALGGDDVADRDQGKAHRVRAAGERIERGRSGAALAAAQDIGADDEGPIGIERPAGADEGLPPAAFAAGAAVAGEGMEDEDGVVPGGVELAPGAVGEGNALQVAAPLQVDRTQVGVAQLAIRLGMARLGGGVRRGRTDRRHDVQPPASLGFLPGVGRCHPRFGGCRMLHVQSSTRRPHRSIAKARASQGCGRVARPEATGWVLRMLRTARARRLTKNIPCERAGDAAVNAVPISRRSLCRNWHLARGAQAAGLHRAVSLHLS